MKPDYRCPRCRSENVQSCPVIYQSGTSGSASVTAADRFIAVTRGKTMTDLARSVAPPMRKKTGWWVTVVLICVTLLLLNTNHTWLIVIALGAACLSGKDNFDAKEYNEQIWPRIYDTWLHSYLCHRCGNIFVIR